MLPSIHYFKYRLGLENPITQTSIAEPDTLKEFAAGKKSLVEIGVFHGVNTLSLREAMAPDAVLVAIDPFKRSFFGIRGYGWARRIAHREVSKSNNGSVVWIEDSGSKTPLRQDVKHLLPVDFIFIDGEHSWEGLQGDWEAWSLHITKGGIVALHDSRNRNNYGAEKFTNEVVLKDLRFQFVKAIDSLTVLQKL